MPIEDMTKTRQMSFGRRQTLVKGPARPLPRWEDFKRDQRERADARKANDAVKELLKDQRPNVDFFTQYGSFVKDGKVQKYSIDIAYDPKKQSERDAVYFAAKKLNDDLYRGMITERHYYQTFQSPLDFIRAKRIRHQGPKDYQTVKSRAKTAAESFLPGGKKGIIEVTRQMKIAKIRVIMRGMGFKLKPHTDRRIARWEVDAMREKRPWWFDETDIRTVP